MDWKFWGWSVVFLRRATENTLTPFDPLRGAKGREEGQGQLQNCEEQKVNFNCSFFFPRWAARNCLTPLIHEGPRRATKGHEEGQGQLQNCEEQKVKGNCNFFFPRWAAKNTLTPFSSTENCLTPLIHEGPRRATKGHEEGQGQLQNCEEQKVKGNCNFFFPRWAAKNTLTPFSSTENCLTPLIHEGPRRATKGHEEGQGQLQNCEEQKVNVNCNFFFPRWAAENCLTPFDPRRAAKGRGEVLFLLTGARELRWIVDGGWCGGGREGFEKGRFALSESRFAGFEDFRDGWSRALISLMPSAVPYLTGLCLS